MNRRTFEEYGGRKDRKRGKKNVSFSQEQSRGQILEGGVKREKLCEIRKGKVRN